MDDLRINLLIVGVVIVIAIILFDRRKKDGKDRDDRSISFNHSQPWHSEHDDGISVNQPDSATSDVDQTTARSTNPFSSTPYFTIPFSKKRQDNSSASEQLINVGEQAEQPYPRLSKEQLSQNQELPLTNDKNTGFKKYVESMLANPSKNNLYMVGSNIDTEPLVIVLNVMSHDGGYFDGQHVKSALETLGLRLGENNIFHFFNERLIDLDLSGQTRKQDRIFSVAKVIEPGYFDYSSINSFSTPGLSLFMQLPGPMAGLLAFKILQNATVLLAEGLDGVICDGNRTKMTPQLINHLRDQISEFMIKMLSKDQVKLS